MPSIDGFRDAGFSCAFEVDVTAGFCGGLRTAFLAGFLITFVGAFVLGAGMDIPGMCICAAAGVANSRLAPNKNESDFRGNSLKK